MGKGLFRGTLLGAIVVFVWMMVSWMVIPWHCSVLNGFKDNAQVSAAILENTGGSGIYLLPNMCDKEHMDTLAESMKEGPVVFAVVKREGFNIASAAPYILAFIIQLIGAFLATYLLLLGKLEGYWKGVWFVTLIGLTVGVLGSLPNWNWWSFPIGFVGVEILDLVIAWFLAGLVIAPAVKK